LQEHEIEKPSLENQGISVKCLKRGSLKAIDLLIFYTGTNDVRSEFIFT